MWWKNVSVECSFNTLITLLLEEQQGWWLQDIDINIKLIDFWNESNYAPDNWEYPIKLVVTQTIYLCMKYFLLISFKYNLI